MRGKVEKGCATALITGASSGIGLEYARELARRGYNLIIISRDKDNLLNVRNELIEQYDIEVWAIDKDLATLNAAEELFGMVFDRRIDILVNNAGIFSFCDITDTPVKRIEQIILLHDMTNTKLCRLFAQKMAEQGGGHILNMSSYSIWMPFPGLALYSASKAYLKSFSVAFSKEVKEKKVYVTAVCPAGIATDLYGLAKDWQKIGLRIGALSTPRFCARRGLNAMFRHQKCIVPDWWWRLFIPICLLIPGFLMKVIRKYTKKFQK